MMFDTSAKSGWNEKWGIGPLAFKVANEYVLICYANYYYIERVATIES